METTPRPRTRRARTRNLAEADFDAPLPANAAPRPRAGAAPSKAQPRAGANRRNLQMDLAAITLVLLAALTTLALARPGSAGLVGSGLVQVIRLMIGHLVFIAPAMFLALGIGLAFDYRRTLSLQMVLGAAGLMVMLFGWVHIAATPAHAAFESTGARFQAMLNWSHNATVIDAPDGGMIGAFVMCLLRPLGSWGPFLTLAALGGASVLLITELTIRGIVERAHERSRIAGERTRQRALAVQNHFQEAAAERAERREERRQQKLFLELGDGTEVDEADEAVPATRTDRRLERAERPIRSLFGSKKAAIAEESLGDDPEASDVTEPITRAVVRVDPPADLNALVLPELGIGHEPILDVTVPDAKVAPRITRARIPKVKPVGEGGEYKLPPLDLLDPPQAKPKRIISEAEQNIAILENTLGQFRIEAQVVEIAEGPSITRYEIRLGEGIRVRKILDLADNIAMSLSAMSVRVEAPIPGKAAIGIEVPKKQASLVTLRECLEAQESIDLKSKVGFVLGKDVAGNVRCADLARMPHLLVAGATNSGKSVCLNVLIASMLFRARPDELKMIMIDPKRVELTLFDGIPHLIHPVVKDVKQAAGILRWVLKEMDRRYDLFTRMMTRNIENYNEKVMRDPAKAGEKLPFLVVVIDELADLMMQQGPEIEQSICRLAQLARATGIHLVIATQRPSVDVITGLIKANVPSRIAFSVSSQIDSRTILDGKGAENLIGRGDMLFKPIDANKPARIQGAFLKEEEVERVVNFLKAQGRPEYIAEAVSVEGTGGAMASHEDAEDELFEPAARFIVTTGHASTSMIQRKFKIGYTRAARLVDLMEGRSIVGALDGAKPREILMSRVSLDEMFANMRNSLHRSSGLDGNGYMEEEEEFEPLPDEDEALDPFVD